MVVPVPDGSRSMTGTWRGNLILLGSALGFSLLLGELAVRLLTPVQLGFEYTEGRFRLPQEAEADTERNRMGFHDFQPGPSRPRVRRVVLLGDSYVAGLSVPIERTVGKQIEQFLSAAGGGEYEVVSLARAGWGQRDQLLELRRRGPALQPDAVVTLFLSLNDVRNNSPELQRIAMRQIKQMQRFRPGWTNLNRADASLFWFEGSRLNQLVSHRLSRLRLEGAAEIPLDYDVYARDITPRWEQAWSVTERLLLQTKQFSESIDAHYAVVSASTPQGVLGAEEGLDLLRRTYPAMNNSSFDLDGPDKRLERYCSAREIPFLRLEPIFRDRTREHGEHLHWRYDGHWNERGHELAGQSIADFLRRTAFR